MKIDGKEKRTGQEHILLEKVQWEGQIEVYLFIAPKDSGFYSVLQSSFL